MPSLTTSEGQQASIPKFAAAAQAQPIALPTAAFHEAIHSSHQLQLSVKGKQPEVGSASHADRQTHASKAAAVPQNQPVASHFELHHEASHSKQLGHECQLASQPQLPVSLKGKWLAFGTVSHGQQTTEFGPATARKQPAALASAVPAALLPASHSKQLGPAQQLQSSVNAPSSAFALDDMPPDLSRGGDSPGLGRCSAETSTAAAARKQNTEVAAKRLSRRLERRKTFRPCMLTELR